MRPGCHFALIFAFNWFQLSFPCPCAAVSVCVSSWTLVTMSVERYYAICQPFRSKSERQTWSHVYKMIGAVWAVSLLLMLPITMLSELQPTREPSKKSSRRRKGSLMLMTTLVCWLSSSTFTLMELHFIAKIALISLFMKILFLTCADKYKCRERWPSEQHLIVFTVLLDVLLFLIPLIVMIVAYSRIILHLQGLVGLSHSQSLQHSVSHCTAEGRNRRRSSQSTIVASVPCMNDIQSNHLHTLATTLDSETSPSLPSTCPTPSTVNEGIIKELPLHPVPHSSSNARRSSNNYFDPPHPGHLPHHANGYDPCISNEPDSSSPKSTEEFSLSYVHANSIGGDIRSTQAPLPTTSSPPPPSRATVCHLSSGDSITSESSPQPRPHSILHRPNSPARHPRRLHLTTPDESSKSITEKGTPYSIRKRLDSTSGTGINGDAHSLTFSLKQPNGINGETNGRPHRINHYNCNQVQLRSSVDRHLAEKRQSHVLRMLVTVIVEFFVCWTPLHVINLLSLYYPQVVYQAIGYDGLSFLYWLAFLSTCTNPITYCFMNRRFRRSFKAMFTCARYRSGASSASGRFYVTHASTSRLWWQRRRRRWWCCCDYFFDIVLLFFNLHFKMFLMIFVKTFHKRPSICELFVYLIANLLCCVLLLLQIALGLSAAKIYLILIKARIHFVLWSWLVFKTNDVCSLWLQQVKQRTSEQN